jgi:integrase
LWTVPPQRANQRTKVGRLGRLHIVPLSTEALSVLELARKLPRPADCRLIFPSERTGCPFAAVSMQKLLRDAMNVDATVHGTGRSSFRDWCAEAVKARPEVAEATLAHQVKDKTEAAYLRAAYLAERTDLTERWAKYLTS